MNDQAEAYLAALPAITASMDAQECAFFFNNSLFLLSRLEKAPGWYVERLPGALVVHAADDWCVALPLTADREGYAASVDEALGHHKPLLRVPRWLAARKDIAGRCEAHYLWPDYVCNTREMQTMEGARRKGIRQRLQRLDRAGDLTVVRLGEEHQREAGELARRWYRQRQPVLRVMYLFEENVWLFENWSTVTARVAGAFGVGVLRGGQLIAANLSCPLSDARWSCHTERYDNEGPLYSNQLAFREACRMVDPAVRPFVNDGPAEAPYRPGVDDLAAFKHRLSAFELQPYRLLRRP